MLKLLKELLEVQELDMQMLRLIRLKRERVKELKGLVAIRNDLAAQCKNKQEEVLETKSNIRLRELELEEIQAKIQLAEQRQDSARKVEEFNALAQEIASAERDKNQIQHQLADEEERLTGEEEVLERLKQSLESAQANLVHVTQEVQEAVSTINEEGRRIKQERDLLAEQVPQEMMDVYLRLLNNKHDRVIVPIENRTCSGCHIMITAQHENMVRRAEKMMFCEHCSRIHYLQEVAVAHEESSSKPRRRRKSSAPVQ